MPKTLKKKCCKKYRHKGKACSNCPLMERLAKHERKDLLARHLDEGKKRKKRKRQLKKKRDKERRGKG